MKKFISMMLTICLMLTIVGCSGGSGNLKGFLADAEGDWYIRGDSGSEMLRIEEDGSWELHEVPESGGESFLSDSGGADSISYDSEYKEWTFTGKNKLYGCQITKDGLLILNGVTYVPAYESRDLSETFNGEWYLDGDRDQDYYKFENGVWDFYESLGMGHGSTNGGYLTYRGGDTKELTAVDPNEEEPFAVLSFVGKDEIRSADSDTYLRLEALDSEDIE